MYSSYFKGVFGFTSGNVFSDLFFVFFLSDPFWLEEKSMKLDKEGCKLVYIPYDAASIIVNLLSKQLVHGGCLGGRAGLCERSIQYNV